VTVAGMLRRVLGRPARALARRMGYDVVRLPVPVRPAAPVWPSDFEPRDVEICRQVAPFTMTSPERIYALRRAVGYVAERGLPGAIVECGVWRGGSMMVAAQTLLDLSKPDYDLFLFDTFEGMPAPGAVDRDAAGVPAAELLARAAPEANIWARSALEETSAAIGGLGYPPGRVHLVAGRVEETIPGRAPERIALLRLDTDWYESTRHELVHLYPRLVPGGVIIIDDYGHWQGARKATDEYLAQEGISLLLNRIDYTGRIGIKSP